MAFSFRKKPEETWTIDEYIWLENVSEHHILLQLDSGHLRLDQGRKLRFRSSVLDQVQVKTLIDDGQLAVHR